MNTIKLIDTRYVKIDIALIKIMETDSGINKLIPLFNMYYGKFFATNNKILYFYHRYTMDNSYNPTRTSRNDSKYMISQLESGYNMRGFMFDFEIFHVAQGIIMHQNTNILLTLALKPDEIYKFDKENIKPEQLVLLIDQKFPTTFKKVFKKVNDSYISVIKELGIDILYTNNIADWCYKEVPNTAIKFRSIPEMKQYLDNLNLIAYGESID